MVDICLSPRGTTAYHSLIEQVRVAVVEPDGEGLVQEPLDARHKRKFLRKG